MLLLFYKLCWCWSKNVRLFSIHFLTGLSKLHLTCSEYHFKENHVFLKCILSNCGYWEKNFRPAFEILSVGLQILHFWCPEEHFEETLIFQVFLSFLTSFGHWAKTSLSFSDEILIGLPKLQATSSEEQGIGQKTCFIFTPILSNTEITHFGFGRTFSAGLSKLHSFCPEELFEISQFYLKKYFSSTADSQQKLFGFLMITFWLECQNCHLCVELTSLTRSNYLLFFFSELLILSQNLSAFRFKLYGRVVKTAHYVFRGAL